MKTDYHIHTELCKHSDLKIKDIIEQYIKNGFTEIGISDHIPYPKPLDSKDNARMFISEMDGYLDEINSAKIKYKNKIKILAGFESEYFPSMNEWYKKVLANDKVDYLTLGIHDVDNLDLENNFNHNCKTPKQLDRYWKAFESGMRTNYFSYAVHPDFYMKSYENWDKHCIELAHKICDLALELDFPLGFNLNGLWKGERKIGNSFRNKYPIKEFWAIVMEKKVKIILESDVHSKKQLLDDNIYIKTEKILKEWNLKEFVIENIILKNI